MTSRGRKKVIRDDLPINVEKCYSLSQSGLSNDLDSYAETKGNLDLCFSLSSLYSELDQLLRDRSSPWCSNLILPHIAPSVESVDSDLLSEVSSDPSCIDLASQGSYNILPCINKRYRKSNPLFYFDPTRYPVTGGFSTPKWKELRNMIMLSSLQCGFKLFCNGKYQIKVDNIMFCCVRRRVYRSRGKTRGSEFRSTSFHNDRLNSRGSKGLNMVRRTCTQKAVSTDSCCPFFFVVSYNEKGFFILNGYGNHTHCYHSKLSIEFNKVPSKVLCSNEKGVLTSMDQSSVNNGICRNVLYQRTGIMMSRGNIRYLNSVLRKEVTSVDKKEVTSVAKASSSGSGSSCADRLLEYIATTNNDFFSLLHQPQTKKLGIKDDPNEFGVFSQSNVYDVCNKLYKSDIDFLVTKENMTEKESIALVDYARKKRSNLDLSDEQTLLIGLCWVTQFEKRLFNLFPKTMFVDCTADTNKEKRPLFTISGKDSNGKMFILLRAYFPNEQAWAFRWIFSTIFPKCFPTETLRRIVFVCSDGDSQEFSQIDAAIRTYFPWVTRGLCGWHIFDRGWNKHGPKIGSHWKKQTKYFKEVTSNVYQWMFSWAKNNCMTEEQFRVSKFLLWKYINSTAVLQVLGIEFRNVIRDFIANCVEIHEEYFCFYLRKRIRNFEEYSNCGHEGTNRAIKKGDDGVNPSHTLDKSAERLQVKAKRNYVMSMQESSAEVTSTPLWIDLNVSKDLVPKGYQLLFEQWKARDNYMSVKVESNVWLVKRLPNRQVPLSCKMIPSFINTNKIYVVTECMYCTCCFFERFGLPCRHMLQLYKTFDKSWEPTKFDVSVHWWSSYYQFGYQNCEDTRRISKILNELSLYEIPGPLCPIPMYNTFPIFSKLSSEWNNFDSNIPNSSNYMISKELFLEAMDMQGTFGMTTLSNIDLEYHGNHDFFESSIVDNLSRDFIRNSQKQETSISFCKQQQLHAYLSSSIKELYSSGSDLSMDRWVTLKNSIDNLVHENHKLQVKQNQKQLKGKVISSCIADCKRKRTHGTTYFK